MKTKRTAHSTYLPILKFKLGEQTALMRLFPNDKILTRPVLEIVPDALKGDRSSYEKIVRQIKKYWGVQQEALVDLALIASEQRAPGRRHPVEFLFDVARSEGLQLAPVTGPERDAAFQAAVASVAAQDGRGVCIRARQDEMFDPKFSSDLTKLLKTLSVGAADSDLLLDWGELQQNQHGATAAAAMSVVASLPSISTWRRLVFAGSAFPATLQAVGVGTALIQRTEWRAWMRFRTRAPREILFGDYTAASPILSSAPYMGSAAIRYTIADDWLVVRGRSLAGAAYGGFSQFVTLAQTLVADQRYCGPAFSWGDAYIEQCAAGTASTGNLTTWRAVATNHHITFVVRQIANLP